MCYLPRVVDGRRFLRTCTRSSSSPTSMLPWLMTAAFVTFAWDAMSYLGVGPRGSIIEKQGPARECLSSLRSMWTRLLWYSFLLAWSATHDPPLCAAQGLVMPAPYIVLLDACDVGAKVACGNGRHLARTLPGSLVLALGVLLKVVLMVVDVTTSCKALCTAALCKAESDLLGTGVHVSQELKDAVEARALICPISHELMRDPVRTCEWDPTRPHHRVYERERIETWLRTANLSPCTGVRLEARTLVPCPTTRELTRQLLAAQPVFSPLGRFSLLDCGAQILERWGWLVALLGEGLLEFSFHLVGIDADVTCSVVDGAGGGRSSFSWTGEDLGHGVPYRVRSAPESAAMRQHWTFRTGSSHVCAAVWRLVQVGRA